MPILFLQAPAADYKSPLPKMRFLFRQLCSEAIRFMPYHKKVKTLAVSLTRRKYDPLVSYVSLLV